MEKTITAAIVSVLALNAGEIEPDKVPIPPPDQGNDLKLPMQLPSDQTSVRKLLLNAFGTREPGPGQLRIPIPAEGAMYEIIIEKPGVPRSVPAGTVDIPK